MMKARTTGKRRRPQWFGSATTVVTWALFWASPSSAYFLQYNNRIEDRTLHNNGDNNSRQQATKKKPLTVFLRDNNKVRRRRRKLQTEYTTFGYATYTPSPTFVPTENPTVSSPPSLAPSLIPSIGPSTPTSFSSPSVQRDRESPTTGIVHIPVISKSTKDPSSPNPQNQPLLKFAAVPVGFDVLLETDSQQDLEEMAQEAKQILQTHLMIAFRQGFADHEGVGVLVRSVDLNVRAFLTPSRRRALLQQQIQRFLQLSRAITLESRGVAGFQVNRNAVDTNQFLAKVNSIIDQSVDPERLMAIFQNSTYGLSEFRVSGVTNTGQASESTKSKPTLVEIIIAFVLIALMLASLGAYAYIFWRKRQKRLKRRKQFGVSGHKTPSPYRGPPRPRPHGAAITPAATTVGQITASPSPRPPFPPSAVSNASSSESSYKGLGSESEDDDADVFAKELRLAASLDRRAWDDFQQRTQQVGSNESEHASASAASAPPAAAPVNSDPIYNSQNDIYRELDEGIEMAYRMSEELSSPPGAVGLTVTGDTVSIHSNNSFPYGDERDPSPEYKPAIQFGTAEAGVLQEANSLNRNDYMAPAAGGERVFEELVERDDTNGGWRMTNVAASELNDSPPKPARSSSASSPRPFSFLYHATESKLEPETHSSAEYPVPTNEAEGNGSATIRQSPNTENASEPTSAGAIRGSPMSISWSTNPRPGSSTENGTTTAVRGSPQGSPQNSSFNTTSRVVSQDGSFSGSPAFGSEGAVNVSAASPAFGSTGAVNEEEIASADGSEGDSSLLTADIVKEVQRLSQFVKTYERKKEHRLKREQERGDDIDLSNSLTSSMDYDSLMDQVASLQNVVDPSPRVSKIKSFQQVEITRKVTSSTRSLTPNQSMSNSPERSLSRQIERMESMQSDDSSDIETMESDDLSRRLGITPFSVQKPLAYQNPPSQMHSISQTFTAYYQRSSSPQEKNESIRAGGRNNTFQEITPRFSNKQSSSHSALSSLRHSGGAILDGSMKDVTSDDFSTGFGRPFTSTNLRDPRTVTPRKRTSSGNRGFDGIVDMFESKEREPLYPPNESWQYNY